MKLVLFDLDGVLVDTVNLHHQALNMALSHYSSKYVINESVKHIFDGKKTIEKLDILSETQDLPLHLHHNIKQLKNNYYEKLIERLVKNQTIINICHTLSKKYILGVCTNSDKNCAETCLKKVGIFNFFKFILTSEDVIHAKPHPEIYVKAMDLAKIDPSDTLIIEDSIQGIEAAHRSKAKVFITDYYKIDIEKINEFITENSYSL